MSITNIFLWPKYSARFMSHSRRRKCKYLFKRDTCEAFNFLICLLMCLFFFCSDWQNWDEFILLKKPMSIILIWIWCYNYEQNNCIIYLNMTIVRSIVSKIDYSSIHELPLPLPLAQKRYYLAILSVVWLESK